jgi:hypothetical protein
MAQISKSAKVASQQYVDDRIDVADALQFKGSIDASTNPDYPAASAGHLFRISVAGKIGGASGPNVEPGDVITCYVDGSASGDEATVGANWDISQSNIDGAVVGPASSTDDVLAAFDGVTGKTVKDSAIPSAAVLRTDVNLQIETWSAPRPFFQTMKDGLVKVSDVLGTSDTVDAILDSAGGGLLSLFSAANAPNFAGKEIVFNKTAARAAYKLVNRSDNVAMYPPEGSRIIFEAPIDFSSYSVSAGTSPDIIFRGYGTVGTDHLLSASVLVGVDTVTLQAGLGANYAKGNLVILHSDLSVSNYSSGTSDRQGEYLRVIDVTGDVITFQTVLEDAYSTVNAARLTKVAGMRNVTVENPLLIGPGKFDVDSENGDKGFAFQYAENPRIAGGEITGVDFMPVIFYTCENPVVSDRLKIIHNRSSAATASESYGVTFADGCRGGVASIDQEGGRHGVVLSNSGSLGVTRDCGAQDCLVRGTYGAAFSTHNVHRGFFVRNVEGVDVQNGVDCRVGGANIDGAKFKLKPGGVGLLIRQTVEDFVARNIEVDGGSWGARIASSDVIEGAGSVIIDDFVFRNQAQDGVDFQITTPEDDAFSATRINILNGNIYDVAGRGIEISGPFVAPLVRNVSVENSDGSTSAFDSVLISGAIGPVVEQIRRRNKDVPNVIGSTGNIVEYDYLDLLTGIRTQVAGGFNGDLSNRLIVTNSVAPDFGATPANGADADGFFINTGGTPADGALGGSISLSGVGSARRRAAMVFEQVGTDSDVGGPAIGYHTLLTPTADESIKFPFLFYENNGFPNLALRSDDKSKQLEIEGFVTNSSATGVRIFSNSVGVSRTQIASFRTSGSWLTLENESLGTFAFSYLRLGAAGTGPGATDKAVYVE